MKAIESGQDWKIAALRSSFHVHFLFGGNMEDRFMKLAFECAKKAYQLNEVPIGAVIVKNGEVIATGYNKKESNCSVLEHAELIAIRKAEEKLHNWRLDDCDMYVTLDPCPMCASAIKQSRFSHVYSALSNSDENNSNIIQSIFLTDHVNPCIIFKSNLFPDYSQKLLRNFFKNKRI